jgi:hypothetical protein
MSFNEKFPICPARRGSTLCLTNLEGLKVPMFISGDLYDVAEL